MGDFVSDFGAGLQSLGAGAKKAILVIKRKKKDGGPAAAPVTPPAAAGGEEDSQQQEQSTWQLLKAAFKENDFKGTAAARVQDIMDHDTEHKLDKPFQLTVQYNPSSLSLRGSSQTVSANPLQQNFFNSLGPQALCKPSVSMTVQLIFDAMNIQDSFLMDKGGLSLGGIISTRADLKQSLHNEEYSVLPQTNGLLSILSEEETQNVTFCWDEMSFSGIVSEAQAAYTMFNSKGNPVRSTVTLVIEQLLEDDADVKQVYQKLLRACSRSGRTVGNAASNLLNLNSFN